MTSDPDNPYANKAISDPHNPYAAPAEVGDVALPSGVELATRSARLVGAIIDGIVMIPLFTLAFFLAFNPGATGLISDVDNGIAAELVSSLIGLVGGLLWYLMVNGYLLATRGQTVGKLAAGTRIVDVETNELVPLWPLFFKRVFAVEVIVAIPAIGGLFGLVDVLMIFRENRRCLHDNFAGTHVIKVSR